MVANRCKSGGAALIRLICCYYFLLILTIDIKVTDEFQNSTNCFC